MKILVTGGAGYVGSVLTTELIGAGYFVRVLDTLMFGGESLLGISNHPRFEFVKGDIRNPDDRSVALASIDAVIHLAAVVGEPACLQHPELARSINLGATHTLADHAKSLGVPRFAFTSTCSNYGISDISVLADEETPLNPVSLYSETKVAAENYVVGLANSRFSPAVMRLATAYGLSPRMRFDLLINELVRDAVSKKWVVIYGPDSWRPFVHVQDIAKAFIALLEAPDALIAGSTFNVGADSENYQKADLAKLIQSHVPHADLEIMDRKRDPRSYRVSFEKIRNTLDFNTTMTVDRGIEEMAEALLTGLIRDPFASMYDNVSEPAIPMEAS